MWYPWEVQRSRDKREQILFPTRCLFVLFYLLGHHWKSFFGSRVIYRSYSVNMPIRTFTVFQDQDASSTTTASFSKSDHSPSAITKENINPLTGFAFDSQPPLKRRKPSSSSALKVKPLPSKPSKSKRFSSTNTGKEKGKRKAVLGTIGSKNNSECLDTLHETEVEQLRTALGNRNAYDLTVMPLADVTQAYTETETASAISHFGKCALDEGEYNTMGTILNALSEEVSAVLWVYSYRYRFNYLERRRDVRSNIQGNITGYSSDTGLTLQPHNSHHHNHHHHHPYPTFIHCPLIIHIVLHMLSSYDVFSFLEPGVLALAVPVFVCIQFLLYNILFRIHLSYAAFLCHNLWPPCTLLDMLSSLLLYLYCTR